MEIILRLVDFLRVKAEKENICDKNKYFSGDKPAERVEFRVREMREYWENK